jgi:tetratricopeptide (TPR) repeat protein
MIKFLLGSKAIWTFLVTAIKSIWGIFYLIFLLLLGWLWNKKWGLLLVSGLLLIGIFLIGIQYPYILDVINNIFSSSPVNIIQAMLIFSAAKFGSIGWGILLSSLLMIISLYPAYYVTYWANRLMRDIPLIKRLLGTRFTQEYLATKGFNAVQLSISSIFTSVIGLVFPISLWIALRRLAGMSLKIPLSFLIIPNLTVPSFKPVFQISYFLLPLILGGVNIILLSNQKKYYITALTTKYQNPYSSIIGSLILALFIPAGVMLYLIGQSIGQILIIPMIFLEKRKVEKLKLPPKPKPKIKLYPKPKPKIKPDYKPFTPKPKPTKPYEKEVIRLQKIIEDKKRINDTDGIARAYHDLGSLHLKYKKYSLAKSAFKEVLAIKEKIGDKRWIGTCYVNLGIANMHQGNYNQAEILFHEALTLSAETDYKYLITLCYHNLGVLYDRYLNQPQDALEMYKACLKMRKELKMSIPIWLEPAIQQLSKRIYPKPKPRIEPYPKPKLKPVLAGNLLYKSANPVTDIIFNNIDDYYVLDEKSNIFYMKNRREANKLKLNLSNPIGLENLSDDKIIAIGKEGKLLVLKIGEKDFIIDDDFNTNTSIDYFSLNPFKTMLAYTSSSEGTVYGMFISSHNEQIFATNLENPTKISFSKNGRYLAIGYQSGKIDVLDVASREIVKSLVSNIFGVSPIEHLNTGYEDSWLTVYKNKYIANWRINGQLSNNKKLPSLATSMAVDTQTGIIAIGSRKGYIRILSSDFKKTLFSKKVHESKINKILILNNAKTIVSVGSDGSIRMIRR